MTPEQIERLKKEHAEIVKSGEKIRLHYFIIGANTVYDEVIEAEENRLYINGELISEVKE